MRQKINISKVGIEISLVFKIFTFIYLFTFEFPANFLFFQHHTTTFPPYKYNKNSLTLKLQSKQINNIKEKIHKE